MNVLFEPVALYIIAFVVLYSVWYIVLRVLKCGEVAGIVGALVASLGTVFVSIGIMGVL